MAASKSSTSIGSRYKGHGDLRELWDDIDENYDLFSRISQFLHGRVIIDEKIYEQLAENGSDEVLKVMLCNVAPEKIVALAEKFGYFERKGTFFPPQ
jgi:hypothetical protein